MDLRTNAYVLIIRNAVDVLIGKDADALLEEQNTLTPDKKMFSYARVVNKRARYNLCFADFSQEAIYEEKKGQ